MLEVAIIICLALALFLVMRRFPQAASEEGNDIAMGVPLGKSFMWQDFFKKRDRVDEIKEAINKGQEGLIAPSEIDEAKKRYSEKNPEIARLLFEADEALEEGDLRTAEERALEAVKQNKRSAQAYVIIGKVAGQRGVFEEAKEAYRMAIKCNKEIASAYFGIGEIDLRNENYTEAIENLQRAVVLSRGEPKWHATLGKAYMEVRQFAKAAKALKRASSLDMDNKEYKELAAEAEEKQRAHAQAFRSR